MSQIVEKGPFATLLKDPSNNFLHPDTEVDDFQNFINSSLLQIHLWYCGKIYINY